MLLIPLIQALRPHQWVKNLLLAVPFLCAHEYGSAHHWVHAILGFLAFSLMASSGYVMNDLKDLEKDQKHPFKKTSPPPLEHFL